MDVHTYSILSSLKIYSNLFWYLQDEVFFRPRNLGNGSLSLPGH